MSASTSRSLLDAIRRGEHPSLEAVRALGEQDPTSFFRDLVEPLSDSFNPAQAEAYNRIMQAFIPPVPRVRPALPAQVDTVSVLSRVTLGSDIKITSILLDAAKRRFPDARIVFAAGRKSAELFATDSRVEHLEANYPRQGSIQDRIAFAHQLREQLDAPNSIVLDPDSRYTQLGLIPAANPRHYFHFPSRTAPGENLTDITKAWVHSMLNVDAAPYIAPVPVPTEGPHPRVAVSFGVGENPAKRILGNFETRLIALLAQRFRTIWLDRRAGGEEAVRATTAAAGHEVRFWEGSFAGFASIISQCDFYLGYDSGAQHAAAAAGTPLITVFAGAPNPRFKTRWAAPGHLIDADTNSPDDVLYQISARLTTDFPHN